jgi:hypothetical protein
MVVVRFPTGGWEFFSSPPRPERLWAPPSLLPNGHQGLCPWGSSGRGVKLTTDLHLEPCSKNGWSYTSTLQYAFIAWCLVKHRNIFTFTFYFVISNVTDQFVLKRKTKIIFRKVINHFTFTPCRGSTTVAYLA